MSKEYVPPTQDEIDRVAEYWNRVQLLSCTHKADLVFDSTTNGPSCSNCGQPLLFMSQIQFEDHITRAKREARKKE